MNLMLLLAQVAPALADSIAGANPVLTPVAAPDEMNLWSMAVKGGWIMVVLGVLSVVCFYILFERNYVIRKAGKEENPGNDGYPGGHQAGKRQPARSLRPRRTDGSPGV